MQAVGGMEAAIDLYESCIVPLLIANCSTWMDMKKEAEDKLDSLQDLFGRVLLKMPQSTPRLAIRGALGLLGMRFRVYQEKVLLVKDIKEQEEDCLAKQVLEEQVRMGWPGLAVEVQEICHLTGLPDITKKEKSDIKETMQLSHLKCLKEEMTEVKLDRMKNTDMRARRSYTKWNLEMCRMVFRLESYQFECRGNMPTRYGRDLICRACRPQEQKEQEQGAQEQEQGIQEQEREPCIEDQEHLECCPGYAELWEGLGPATEESRVKYFMRVKLKRLKQQQNST